MKVKTISTDDTADKPGVPKFQTVKSCGKGLRSRKTDKRRQIANVAKSENIHSRVDRELGLRFCLRRQSPIIPFNIMS